MSLFMELQQSRDHFDGHCFTLGTNIPLGSSSDVPSSGSGGPKAVTMQEIWNSASKRSQPMCISHDNRANKGHHHTLTCGFAKFATIKPKVPMVLPVKMP